MGKSILLLLCLAVPSFAAEFPWGDVDSLIRLDLDTRRFNPPSGQEMSQRGCSAEQVKQAEDFAKLAPSQLPSKVLGEVLTPKEMREAAFSAKEAHHSYLLGRILMLNLLREEAREKKVSPKALIEKAIAQGDVEASAWQTGHSFWNTLGEKTDWKAGWTALNAAAEKGNGRAYYLLATYYAVKNYAYSKFTTSFVPDAEKTQKFRAWICKSAELGYPEGIEQCGNLLYMDKGEARDLAAAEKWLIKAAHLGLVSNALDSLKCFVPNLKEICPVCESLEKKGERAPALVPKQFLGVYSLKVEDGPPQYLVLRANGESSYLGEEDFGEHGAAYFGTSLEDLRVSDSGKIEFRIGERNYFDKPFKPEEPLPRQGRKKGFGRGEMFFQGEIKGKRASLVCKGDCSGKTEFTK